MIEKKSILTLPEEFLTPGMQQYKDVKKEHPDCLVMLRMGDFYEMFYEDAITASKELEITLTSRGKGERCAPLAGVPFHAAESYISKLIKKGFKVAIVEQLEDPRKAKGLVKRGLVRIITPGTTIDAMMLSEKENNYLMAFSTNEYKFAGAFCDLSTGEFFTAQYATFSQLLQEMIRLNPSECLIPQSLLVNKEIEEKMKGSGFFINSLSDHVFSLQPAKSLLLKHFKASNLHHFGLEEYPLNICVSGALLDYLKETQKTNLSHIRILSLRSNQSQMFIEASTLRNLELIKNMRDGSAKGTLLSILDHTLTPMGGRLLRRYIKEPLLTISQINVRLEAVEQLSLHVIQREELREQLLRIQDIERLIGRISYGNATPRDLLSLKNSLQNLPQLKQKLVGISSKLLQEISSMPDLSLVFRLLDEAIREDAPLTIREGEMIKPTFDKELEELTNLTKNSKSYIQKLEDEEKKRTGISSLKIGFNKVFGYYIEITKKNLSCAPPEYIRKQTTANGERFITQALKEEEEKIVQAQERMSELEYDLFQKVCKEVLVFLAQIQECAAKIGCLDVLCSLSKVALEHNYTKPQLVEENILEIIKGRHPVVEVIQQDFIPNDIFLKEGEMMIITGPNMAGKSTIMRQVALIVLMAQMGSFVPAESCVMGLCDRIFTRVGAYDDLSSGQSTFMVEMNETAAILHNATKQSLIILDEIGRGTSTFDGVSLAVSIAEYIYHTIKAKTLFATHYHVMNNLAEKFSKIKNYNVAISQEGEDLVFLHKLVAGGCDQSYGVHVAKLAGLPKEVVERAGEIQKILEKDDEIIHKLKVKAISEQKSLDSFKY